MSDLIARLEANGMPKGSVIDELCCEAAAALAASEKDAARLDALEAFSTLHQSPSFLYVVVGYTLNLERSDGRKDVSYEAETLREAIDAAISQEGKS